MQLLTATLLLPGAMSSSDISTQPRERTAKHCQQGGKQNTTLTRRTSAGYVKTERRRLFVVSFPLDSIRVRVNSFLKGIGTQAVRNILLESFMKFKIQFPGLLIEKNQWLNSDGISLLLWTEIQLIIQHITLVSRSIQSGEAFCSSSDREQL